MWPFTDDVIRRGKNLQGQTFPVLLHSHFSQISSQNVDHHIFISLADNGWDYWGVSIPKKPRNRPVAVLRGGLFGLKPPTATEATQENQRLGGYTELHRTVMN
jgi:hypothetical protein